MEINQFIIKNTKINKLSKVMNATDSEKEYLCSAIISAETKNTPFDIVSIVILGF